MCNSENSTPFMLKSNQNFMQRQKDVFDQLNSMTSTLHNNILEDMDVDAGQDVRKPKRSSTRHFRGKESIFKRPDAPISRNYMRNIPDFKKNPHKWKKYTLADVREEDMSETCNTKTALTFLNELKKRNEEKCAVDEDDDGPKKIVFKKKSVVTESGEGDVSKDKPSFRSSKLVMPEYAVGQKVTKEKKHHKKSKGETSQLKLDHLLEVDD